LNYDGISYLNRIVIYALDENSCMSEVSVVRWECSNRCIGCYVPVALPICCLRIISMCKTSQASIVKCKIGTDVKSREHNIRSTIEDL